MSFVMSMLLTTATVAAPSHAPALPGTPVRSTPAATAPAAVPAESAKLSAPATAVPGTTVATPATGAAPAAAPAKVAAPAPVADPLLAIERQIVSQTNSHRARHGLRPLQVDLRLMQSARRHAAWMASRRLMQHGRAAVAENIAAGQSTPTEAVRDWMNSSGHRANILNSRYSRIGVAAYRGPDGQVYWCQQFLW